MKDKRIVFVVVAVVAMLGMAGQALAYTYTYDLTVPKLVGYAQTSNEYRTTACTYVSVNVTATGGNYTLYAKAQDGSNNQLAGTSAAAVTSGSFVSWTDTTSCGIGAVRNVVFNNYNSVDVEVAGSWTPN